MKLRKDLVFVATLKYRDKEFVIHCKFNNCLEESAIFMFEEGNYSCDCNRSLFIRWEYGEDAIPELQCGEEIKMIDYHFEYNEK